MDVARGFKAAFEDPQWVGKLLLALLFEILVVTAPAVIGYWLRYTRNVAEGRDNVLPEWNEFGTMWGQGFLVILAAIAYVIVGFILLVVGIIPALITLQAAMVEYAMTGRAGSLFAISTVWKRITTHTTYWTAFLVVFALNVVTSGITSGFVTPNSSPLRGIGFTVQVVVGLYVLLVQANLFGQWARGAYGVAAPAMGGPGHPSGAYYPPSPPPGTYPPPPPGAYPPPPAPGGYQQPAAPQPAAYPPPPSPASTGGYQQPAPPQPAAYPPPPSAPPSAYPPPPPPQQSPDQAGQQPPASPEQGQGQG